MAEETPTTPEPERRLGPRDRRMAAEDRRNAERVAEDLAPRRDPELPDRRRHASAQQAASPPGTRRAGAATAGAAARAN